MLAEKRLRSLRAGDRLNIWLSSYCGAGSVSVRIESLCPRRSRVRTLRNGYLPGRGWSPAGTVIHVPTDMLLEGASV